jgi:ATP-dependent Clp protease ATP-binding subunit ClpA
MGLREETLQILKEKFGPEKACKVLDYIESRVRTDVATQKDVYELKLEIEKIRVEIARVRSDLEVKIEKVRTDLLKWSFGFWVTQIAILVGILFKLLS